MKAPKNSTEKTLIVIGGPTAVGKTDLSLLIATNFNCPIISADSRQFYKELSIGTAKPSKEERSLAPHHFIDSLNIHDEYSVGDFERDVLAKLEILYQKNDVVVMVGGTGLYINAVLEGLDEFPKVRSEIKRQFTMLFKKEGIIPLQTILNEKDPEYAAKADLSNPQRLIRALSVIESSGQKFSSFLKKKKTPRSFISVKIALTMERHLLYDRINRRVDNMMEKGLLKEAVSLFEHRHFNALNTVGYSELFQHIEGKIFLSEAVEKIKQNSRRYAKRQMTWFRNQGQWLYFESGKDEKILDFLKKEVTRGSIDGNKLDH